MTDRGAIQAMRVAAHAISSADHLDAARAIQTAINALEAELGDRLAAIDRERAHDLEGASATTTWARTQLRLAPHETRSRIAAARVKEHLAEVSEAAAAGQIRHEHVAAFTYGYRHIAGSAVAEAQPWLLGVATTSEPKDLLTVVRELRSAVHPEELDRAWAAGMDRQDLQVNAVPDGYHVNGFLDTTLGAKMRAVLDSLGAPVDADDRRTGSERRIDALGRLVDSVLDHGLPSDKGVRPHLSVLVDVETLAAAIDPMRAPDSTVPAHLVGFGSIGPQLLGYLGCLSDMSAILVRGEARSDVLDVGRTRRLATPKQRLAVLARQGHECAAPGCRNTHLEIHHVSWWSEGGRTDLSNLVGLCSRCHHLVHRRLLVIRPAEAELFAFVDRDHRALVRAHRHRVALRRQAVLEARRQPAVSRR